MKSNIFKNNRPYLAITVALFAIVGVGLLVFSQAATPGTTPNTVGTLAGGGNASLYLTPASGGYDNGSTLTVGVFEDSVAQAANAVSVLMSYNASQLELVSIDSGGTAFAGCPTKSGAGGTISLVCYVSPPSTLTGKQRIANITFKVLVGTGTSSISFVSESASNSKIALAGTGDNIWNGATAGGTYTLKTPATGGGGTGGGGSGGTTTTPPATSNTGNSAPKTTTTGGASSTPKNVAPATGGPSPVAPTENNSQSPVGSQGTVSSEASQVVAIRVIDAKGNALSGVSVSLGTLSAVSDSNGVASFSGVVAGAYTVTAKTPDGQATAKIQVKSGVDSSTAQEFQLQVKPKNMLVYYAIIGATIAFVGVVVALVAKNIITKRKSDRAHGLLGNNTAVVFGANSPTKVQETEAIPMITPAEPKVAPITPPNTSEPAPTGLEGTLITPDNSTPKTPQL